MVLHIQGVQTITDMYKLKFFLQVFYALCVFAKSLIIKDLSKFYCAKKLVKIKINLSLKSVVNLFFRKKNLIVKLINFMKLFRLRVG